MSLHHHGRFHAGHVRWSLHWPARSSQRVHLGPDFTKLWGAGIASNLADGISYAALPLLAATLTRDPLLVALTAVIQSLPWFLFELIAGEFVDRTDRKQLMLWGNVARGGGITAIAVFVAADLMTLPILYVIAFGIGIAETLVDTSWETMVPRLVEPDDLEAANGRTQAAEWTANQLIGPPLGGLLFAAAVAVPFFFNTGAFLLAVVLIALIPGTFRADREVAHGRGSMRRDIGEGITWLWHHRVLRALSFAAGTSNLVATAMFSVFVLFSLEILGLSDLGFGFVLAGTGVGGVIGAATARRVEKRLGPGTMLLGSMAGMALSALAIALTSSPLVVAAAFAVDGFLVSMWNVVVVSLRQALTPDELRGRVASVARTVAFGAIPIGATVGGVLSDVISLRAPYFLAAGTYVVAVILLARVVSNDTIAQLRAEAARDLGPDPGRR